MKIIAMSFFVFFAVWSTSAQEVNFGVKAGFLVTSYDAYSLNSKDYPRDYLDLNGNYPAYGYGSGKRSNVSEFGIYLGGFADFKLIDDFRLQPELTVYILPDTDLGYIAINVPVLVKYSFFPKFYAMAGPAFNYAVSGDDEQFSPSFDLGASYDILDDFYVEVRGDIGLSGYLGTSLNAGVGYRL